METEQKSIAKQEQEIRDILQKYVHRSINTRTDGFEELKEIMAAQPKWANKLDKIYAFKVTRAPRTKALLLQVKLYNLNRWLTVSWRRSTAKKRKPADPLPSAFRNSIRGQIDDWKRSNAFHSGCVKCGSRQYLEADHDNPSFLELTQNFLKTQDLKRIPTKFGYVRNRGRKFRPADLMFELWWQQYHARLARLQWLCKKCNMSKSKTHTPTEDGTGHPPTT
jgi:hypothetical protein